MKKGNRINVRKGEREGKMTLCADGLAGSCKWKQRLKDGYFWDLKLLLKLNWTKKSEGGIFVSFIYYDVEKFLL